MPSGAMSLDGRIATRTGDSKWISGEASRARAHELRGRCDAILVGVGTVLADDPLLTARPAGPRVATRIVLDSRARTPVTSQLVRTAAQSPVIIATSPAAPAERVAALRDQGVELLPLSCDTDSARPSLRSLLAELGQRKMTHLLLEGGAGLLGSAFDQHLVDECHAFVAPRVIGGENALSPVGGSGVEAMRDVFSLAHIEWQQLGPDLYLHGDCP
jgi:diaminohydroxyphosphoribosylaminopyrimidine deaminase/5-amino-6-(5-phosphoribosylamino)uracil reductase